MNLSALPGTPRLEQTYIRFPLFLLESKHKSIKRPQHKPFDHRVYHTVKARPQNRWFVVCVRKKNAFSKLHNTVSIEIYNSLSA